VKWFFFFFPPFPHFFPRPTWRMRGLRSPPAPFWRRKLFASRPRRTDFFFLFSPPCATPQVLPLEKGWLAAPPFFPFFRAPPSSIIKLVIDVGEVFFPPLFPSFRQLVRSGGLPIRRGRTFSFFFLTFSPLFSGGEEDILPAD